MEPFKHVTTFIDMESVLKNVAKDPDIKLNSSLTYFDHDNELEKYTRNVPLKLY